MLKMEKKLEEVLVTKREIVEKVQVTFHGLPVIGDVHLINEATTFLFLTWDGYVSHAISSGIDQIPVGQFEPVDKGGFGVFGTNSTGKVIFAIAKYSHGIETKRFGKYDKPCFLILKAKETNPYTWER